MRAVIVLLLTFLTCPFFALIPPITHTSIPTTYGPVIRVGPLTYTLKHTQTPTPVVITPTPLPIDPHVDISADRTTLRVGETVTIRAVPVKIGLSIFTLLLSSGGQARVRYDNQEQTVQSSDPHFEIVSMSAEMWLATFTLRAFTAGSVDVTVDASGELDYGGSYSWSARTSP